MVDFPLPGYLPESSQKWMVKQSASMIVAVRPSFEGVKFIATWVKYIPGMAHAFAIPHRAVHAWKGNGMRKAYHKLFSQ